MRSPPRAVSSMRCCTERRAQSGQATVEAAFVLPVVFALCGLLLQPAILLYERCVMVSAAAETCRLAATQPCSDDAMRAFALRRLALLPGIDLFHSSGCEWEVQIEPGGSAAASSVRISGHLKTLPLLGITASSMTEEAGDGCALLSCQVSSQLHPAWLQEAGGTPAEWIGRWE